MPRTIGECGPTPRAQQTSIGDGGTCYGDSGGPHFLGGVESNLIVSVTVTGDAMCRASDKTYRIDTPWAEDPRGRRRC
jgi:secreted trypsin-like serine protease